jgi:c-di-GMP-binding flagellar brake protein YcgR
MDNNILEVGLPISIETYYKYYLNTHLIGWERDLYLITGIVQSAGKTGQLKVNDRCKMRFLKDGTAYGFETKILAINFNPFPVMYSKFPKVMEQSIVRKFDRIKANIPARFLDMDGNFIAAATITDISAGGCGLEIPVREGKELACENTYKIIYRAMESDIQLCCAIRKMRTVKNTLMLGIEFIDISRAEGDKIKSFMDVCTNIITAKMDLIMPKMKTAEKILGAHLKDVALPICFKFLTN